MRFALGLLLLLLVSHSGASAGVIYDFVSSEGFGVMGSLDFDPDNSNARPDMAWADAGDLGNNLLLGGISGFTWGGVTPLSGDLLGGVNSDDGSELDAGSFGDGVVFFPGDVAITSLQFNTLGPNGIEDIVNGDSFGTFSFFGDWVLRVPEPSTFVLGGLSLLGLVFARTRRS